MLPGTNPTGINRRHKKCGLSWEPGSAKPDSRRSGAGAPYAARPTVQGRGEHAVSRDAYCTLFGDAALPYWVSTFVCRRAVCGWSMDEAHAIAAAVIAAATRMDASRPIACLFGFTGYWIGMVFFGGHFSP